MNKETGGPAFPTEGVVTKNGIVYDGMTLRDYFAAKALTAFFTNIEDDAYKHPTSVALWCYEMADAMLKVREQ